MLDESNNRALNKEREAPGRSELCTAFALLMTRDAEVCWIRAMNVFRQPVVHETQW